MIERYLCPEPGCGRTLTAYYTFKAGHPVDEEFGLCTAGFGNVSFGAEWQVLCDRGHLVGRLSTPEDEDHDIPPEHVEIWLQGRLWGARHDRPGLAKRL